MKVERMKWITRSVVKANPNKAFVFGDNVERRGMGGQAREMRGEPNAFGIVTKHAPTMRLEDFFTDSEYGTNVNMIANDLDRLMAAGFETVVVPANGIGTGLAELDKRAPLTFRYLEKRLAEL